MTKRLTAPRMLPDFRGMRDIPIGVRFWAKVEIGSVDECWPWRGGVTGAGYGVIMLPRGARWYKATMAHRFAYERRFGAIPAGKVLDHVCRNTRCVNPYHLRVCSQKENISFSSSHIASKMRQTHCVRNHPLSGTNLYLTPDGRRQCRACMRLRADKSNNTRRL